MKKSYLIIKKIIDILFCLVGLVFFLISTILIKIAYMLTGDFNSIFYTQDRIGKDGVIFRLYKFRTMICDADDVLSEVLSSNKELAREYKINKKLKDDPRITKVGKLIRKISLDELPQILNILKGDMTLIGNRPYLVKEKEDMGKFFYDIVKTKPGLTGLWQTNGRSDTSFKRRLKIEKYYSNNCSLSMDLKIFFRTFKVVLSFKGAK